MHNKLDDSALTSSNIEDGTETPCAVTRDDNRVILEDEQNVNISNTNSSNINTLPDGSFITYGAQTWYKQIIAAMQSSQFKQASLSSVQ
jgi:hypothetical protein